MTSTTKTAVGSPRLYVVTAGEIEEFCEVTGDGNNIHKGGSPVVPGFLLVGIAKNHIGELVQGAHPELNFSGIEAKFTAKLHAGEDFVVKPTGSYDPSNGSIPYTISRTNDGVVASRQSRADEVLRSDGSLQETFRLPGCTCPA